METSLIQKAKLNNDHELVNFLYNNYIEFQSESKSNSHSNKIALALAIVDNNLPILRKIMEVYNVPLGDFRQTALIHACYYGHINIVQYLLRTERDLNIENALIESIDSDHKELVRLFLNINASDCVNNTYLPRYAIYKDKKWVLEIFMDFNLDINMNDCELLILACELGNLSMVEYLVYLGANIHYNGNDILFYAFKNLEILQYLIEQGVNIHEQNDIILLVAFHYNCEETFKYLIYSGSNINVSDDEILINSIDQNRSSDFIKFLLDNGATINAQDNFPLRMAIYNSNFEVVKLLLEYGVDFSTNNYEAFRIAVSKGYIDIVTILTEFGSDINTQNGESLTIAVWKGYFEIVKFLVYKGVNFHARDEEALITACFKGYLNIVVFLVENGADIHIQDDRAFTCALEMGHQHIFNYLHKYIRETCNISLSEILKIIPVENLETIRGEQADTELRCKMGMDLIHMTDFSGCLIEDLKIIDDELISFIMFPTRHILCSVKSQLFHYWNTKHRVYKGIIAQTDEEYRRKKIQSFSDETNIYYFMNFDLLPYVFFIRDNQSIVYKSEKKLFLLIPTKYKFYDINPVSVGSFHNVDDGGNIIYIIIPA